MNSFFGCSVTVLHWKSWQLALVAAQGRSHISSISWSQVHFVQNFLQPWVSATLLVKKIELGAVVVLVVSLDNRGLLILFGCLYLLLNLLLRLGSTFIKLFNLCLQPILLKVDHPWWLRLLRLGGHITLPLGAQRRVDAVAHLPLFRGYYFLFVLNQKITFLADWSV